MCHSETVLRALAEGRVPWAFWPPGTDRSKLSATGDGIWIRGNDDDAGVNSDSSDGEEEEDMEHDRESESGDEGSKEDDSADEEGEEEEEEEEESKGVTIGGRFGALALEDVVTEED